MTEPSAYEIAEAFSELSEAVDRYQRYGYSMAPAVYADRLVSTFTAFARLLDRVKEPT